MKREGPDDEGADQPPPAWQTWLAHTLATTEPIRKRPQTLEQQRLPKIVNLVSTVELLPQGQGYKLPLHAIARALACAQYAPVLFAANILKFTDSIGDCTPLVFASGKIVVVSGQTPYHTLYMSQLTRFIVEQVRCAMLRPDGSVDPCGSLVGRTIFKDCAIHNIVGHAELGCRINLQAMCEAAPSACKWVPDLFPGLKCRMWLTGSGRCECAKAKCVCAVKVLVFDTGRIVITGGRSIADVNTIYFRIRAMAPAFAAGHANTVIPREDRFYQRLSTLLVPSGDTMKDVEVVEPGEMTEMEALETLFAEQARLAAPAQVPDPPPHTAAVGDTPLMQMAQAGRVEEVRMLLAFQPDAAYVRDQHGRTTLQRLKLVPQGQRTQQQQEIIEMLMQSN